MNARRSCVAVIGEEHAQRRMMADVLHREGARVVLAASSEEAWALMRRERVDAVFISAATPQAALPTRDAVRQLEPEMPLVVVTSDSTQNLRHSELLEYVCAPVTSLKIGQAWSNAAKSVRKNSQLPRVRLLGTEQQQHTAEGSMLAHGAPENGGAEESSAGAPALVAASTAMRVVVELADRIAPSGTHVCIQGESGTGKQLLARRIHASSRRAGPLLCVKCAALRGEQWESELFGAEHAGETASLRPGWLEQARDGTLFLSDTADMPHWIQGRLEEAIERGWFLRSGGQQQVPLRTRLILASGEDFAAWGNGGAIRPSLFYALGAVAIRVPPLRDRAEDIRLLTEREINVLEHRHGARAIRPVEPLSPQAWAALLAHPWPGNVRELFSVLRQAHLASEGGPLAAAVVRQLTALPSEHPAGDMLTVPLRGDLRSIERAVIAAVIQRFGGNKAAAARALGLHRKTMYRLLGRYGGELAGDAGADAPEVPDDN